MGLRVFAVALMVLGLPVPSASAQSFLEALFGFSSSPSSRSYGRARERSRERQPRETARERPAREARSYYTAPQTYERSGTYRTYCVRMCDGFYYPLNYASTNLTRDAQRCSASCEGARLFYHRTGGEPEDMVDQQGRSYTSYPIAFKHRTELVQGCQCRPPPWTETELERHKAYALKLKPSAPQSRVPPPVSRGAAGPNPSNAVTVSSTLPMVPAANRTMASPRPEPIARPAAEPAQAVAEPGEPALQAP